MLTRLWVSLGVIAWMLLGAVGLGDSPSPPVEAKRPADGKLRIIVFGAHSDDAESDRPQARPRNSLALVNRVMSEKEPEKLRTCIARNRPYGEEQWQTRVAKRLGLSYTLRNEGWPKAIRSDPNQEN